MNEPLEINFKLSKLEAYIKRFPVGVIHKAIEIVAFALKGSLVEEAPVDEGYLRGSINEPVAIGPAEFGITIDAKYWKYVQFGTGKYGPHKKPYDIFPKTKQALRFVVGGKAVFAKYVKGHPGMKPNPFIDRAMDAIDNVIPSAVRQALEEAA